MVEWKAPDTPAATVDEVDTFERCSRWCLSDLLLDELGLFLFNYKYKERRAGQRKEYTTKLSSRNQMMASFQKRGTNVKAILHNWKYYRLRHFNKIIFFMGKRVSIILLSIIFKKK
jgi:hypothetical protein